MQEPEVGNVVIKAFLKSILQTERTRKMLGKKLKNSYSKYLFCEIFFRGIIEWKIITRKIYGK